MFQGAVIFLGLKALGPGAPVRKDAMSTAEGRRMAFIFTFSFIYPFFLFLMAGDQGGTIGCEGISLFCFFLTLRARPIERDFL